MFVHREIDVDIRGRGVDPSPFPLNPHSNFQHCSLHVGGRLPLLGLHKMSVWAEMDEEENEARRMGSKLHDSRGNFPPHYFPRSLSLSPLLFPRSLSLSLFLRLLLSSLPRLRGAPFLLLLLKHGFPNLLFCSEKQLLPLLRGFAVGRQALPLASGAAAGERR